MKLIPVIDLKAGQVVRAVRGQRATYRPVVSQLCAGSEPVTVARALLAHCTGDTLYVADLDALTGGPVQFAALAELGEALPGVTIWLDAGFARLAAARALCARLATHAPRIVPVLASETLRDVADLPQARDGWILSLDARDGAALDRTGCWQRAELWPPQIIVMTLDRVGAQQGPDLDTLRSVQGRADRAFFGAGGIRHAADLQAAAEAGAAGWLLASALHDRRLPRRQEAAR